MFQSDEVKQLLSSYSKPLRKSKSLDAKDLQRGKSPDKGKWTWEFSALPSLAFGRNVLLDSIRTRIGHSFR